MPAQLTSAQRVLAVGLVLGVSLVAFETTAVVTALPTITDELGGDSLYGVTLAAYMLANLVALVAAGELADRRGPAFPFVVSVTTFIAGLVVAAAAPTMWVVVLGRVLQGAGSGGFAPIAYVLVKRAFPADRQALMYAFLSAGWVLPSLMAPAFAGEVTDRFGWRWVFLGIVPLAIAVGALAVRPMLDYEPSTAGNRAPTRIPTAGRGAAGVGAIVVGLQFANPFVAAATVAAGIAVAVPSLRALFPPRVFSAGTGLPAVVVCRLLATATFLGVDSFIPLAADRVHGASPRVQGFVIIGSALSWSFGQWLMARRPFVDPARAVRLGFALLLLAVGLAVPVLSASWPLWATFITWSVGGLGMGVLFNPTSVAAMSYARDGDEGRVSSQVSLADSLGFALMGGIGGASVAIADRTSWSLTSALGTNFAIAAGLACLGLLASRGIRAAGAGAAGSAGVATAASR